MGSIRRGFIMQRWNNKQIIKKIVLIVFLSLIFLSPRLTFASEGLLRPNSRLYFLVSWAESAKLFFTFSEEQKLDYLLELTNRRVDEMKDIPSSWVASRYEEHFRQLNELSNQAEGKERAVEKIKETSLRQQAVLARVYTEVPENAKDAILAAQENSSQQVAQTIEMVEGTQKAQEYIQQVTRLQQLEKMGQVELLQKLPMEESPNSDPSTNIPKELKGANPLLPGQNLNTQNQGLQGQEGGSKMEPAAPFEMNAPAGQN